MQFTTQNPEKTLHLVSLGCTKNLVDSEVMLGKLKDYKLTNDTETADVIIVNTCGFIDNAKEESINTILNYAEALLETGGDALTQINLITSNRGASAYASVTKDDILNERRKELMFEGFRFDDMMRTGMDMPYWGTAQNSLGIINYPSDLFPWPIPIGEINANSNMEQNAGY